ncbi:MAG: efflux RND transporter permease subunit [Sphaerochaetaceae bacterium]|jgi:HAE1 family hydrophobic/amphiphilic exporter-1|nr:efflux RND transporter permease subunit [Sphaerochaetaceae bacterium]HHU89044.1 efflux RND transporter permease subunit [Spirochaetales bacterium]
MKISHFSVDHPVVIAMLVIALCVFGIYSFLGLNMEFMGDISLPSVEVLAFYPGAGATDVEHDVTAILEEEFVTLPDFKGIVSKSFDSYCWITINFRDSIDPYDMLPEVRDRIRRLEAQLPEDLLGEPQAIVGGATMIPVFMFSVEGGEDRVSLSRYVKDEMIPQITKIPGVANVSIIGDDQLELRITLSTEKLQATGISALQVYQVLSASNARLPIGEALYRGRSSDIRFDGAFSTSEDIALLPVGADASGAIVRLADVADMRFEPAERDVYVDSGGKSLLMVSVTKRLDGNVLSINRAIKKVLESVQERTEGAITTTILADDSRDVGASLSTVTTSGLLGVVMAVIVIIIFLSDIRATIIISVSIPLSILFTLTGMRVAGLTINLISLSGLVVALGMVVDASIVMLEQVYRHYKSGEMGVVETIKTGASEVGSSIMASTLTTVVVFIPIALMKGLVGNIVRDLAVSLIFALLASLVVALAVVPFLMRVLLKPQDLLVKRDAFSARPVAAIERFYGRVIKRSFRRPRFIITAATGILVLTFVVAQFLGYSFIPSTDNGDFYIDMEFAVGTPLGKTREKAQLAEEIIRREIDELESVTIFSGQESGFAFTGSARNAYARVLLVDRKLRNRSVHEIMLSIQDSLVAELPGATIKTTNGGYDKLIGFISGGGGYGLTLTGENLETLVATADEIKGVLNRDPDVVSVNTNSTYDSETLVLDVSHELMGSVGISSYEAAVTSAILFRGLDAGVFTHTDGKRYDIQLDSDLKNMPISENTLATIFVPGGAGENVSFADISSLHRELTISQINKIDRAKSVTISATLVSEDTSGINKRMGEYLKENPLPVGVSSQSGGILELIEDSLGPVAIALGIGIFLVYSVMVIQFERFRQPFIIMVSIPFCLIGVVGGLLAFGSTISLIAVIGVIALGGVVVNNAIILIDYTNLLRERREKELDSTMVTREQQLEILDSSIIDGASSRIRPIFMTTLTTIFGVVPMAFATGLGSEIYAPLGQAIAGGLISSTIITLYLVPILYRLTERRRIYKRNSLQEAHHA